LVRAHVGLVAQEAEPAASSSVSAPGAIATARTIATATPAHAGAISTRGATNRPPTAARRGADRIREARQMERVREDRYGEHGARDRDARTAGFGLAQLARLRRATRAARAD